MRGLLFYLVLIGTTSAIYIKAPMTIICQQRSLDDPSVSDICISDVLKITPMIYNATVTISHHSWEDIITYILKNDYSMGDLFLYTKVIVYDNWVEGRWQGHSNKARIIIPFYSGIIVGSPDITLDIDIEYQYEYWVCQGYFRGVP